MALDLLISCTTSSSSSIVWRLTLLSLETLGFVDGLRLGFFTLLLRIELPKKTRRSHMHSRAHKDLRQTTRVLTKQQQAMMLTCRALAKGARFESRVRHLLQSRQPSTSSAYIFFIIREIHARIRIGNKQARWCGDDKADSNGYLDIFWVFFPLPPCPA